MGDVAELFLSERPPHETIWKRLPIAVPKARASNWIAGCGKENKTPRHIPPMVSRVTLAVRFVGKFDEPEHSVVGTSQDMWKTCSTRSEEFRDPGLARLNGLI
jgi:hypothetical protein